MRIEGENREKWRDFLEWRKKETLTVDKNGCGKKNSSFFFTVEDRSLVCTTTTQVVNQYPIIKWMSPMEYLKEKRYPKVATWCRQPKSSDDGGRNWVTCLPTQ